MGIKIDVYLLLAIAGLGHCLDCPGCNQVCSKDFCKISEHCYLRTSPCANETCPKVPTCVSAREVCHAGIAYKDETGAVQRCLDSSSKCPAEHRCENGYCCMELSAALPGFDDPHEDLDGGAPESDDDIPFPLNFFVESDSVDVNSEHSVPGCTPCATQRCQFAICNYAEPTSCIADNCSCTISFVDRNGRPVECAIPDEGQNSDLPEIFEVDLADPDKEKGVMDQPSSTAASSTVGVTPKKPVKTLQSADSGSRKQNPLVFIVGALGLAVILAAIGFATYKLCSGSTHKQSQNIGADNADVKVPLNDMSYNNNEVKNGKPLFNGHGEP